MEHKKIKRHNVIIFLSIVGLVLLDLFILTNVFEMLTKADTASVSVGIICILSLIFANYLLFTSKILTFKKLSLLILTLFLFNCGPSKEELNREAKLSIPKSYTIKVKFSNGDIDTIKYQGTNNSKFKLYKNNLNHFITNFEWWSYETIASSISYFEIINNEKQLNN